MKRVLTILGALAVSVGAIGLSSTADAGDDPPTPSVVVFAGATGSQKGNLAAYPPSFIVDGGATITPTCAAGTPAENAFAAAVQYTCDLAPGSSYELVLPTPPAPHAVVRSCGLLGGPIIDFTSGSGLVICRATVVAPTVAIDKVLPQLESGPLEVDDFTLEIFPEFGGEVVGTTNDPSPEMCESEEDIGILCGWVELEPGRYALGEEPEYGYTPFRPVCESDWPDGGGVIIGEERFDDLNATFGITPEPDDLFSYFARCTVGNLYVESQLDVYKTVTNDDGRTATPDDWTIELYDDEGAIVTTVACALDGTCLSDTFPIGQYTVGEVGPDGYVSTVTQTVTTEPIDLEILPDEEATFVLEWGNRVDITIASDDQPTTTSTTSTTTTTTTTIADSTTTTEGPTTTAGSQTTTTAFDAGAGTLPATGSGQRNASMALLAIGLLLFGTAAVLTTRRR